MAINQRASPKESTTKVSTIQVNEAINVQTLPVTEKTISNAKKAAAGTAEMRADIALTVLSREQRLGSFTSPSFHSILLCLCYSQINNYMRIVSSLSNCTRIKGPIDKHSTNW